MESWKCDVHKTHCDHFTMCEDLDGVNSSYSPTESTLRVVQPVLNMKTVKTHQDVLFSVLSNINSKSLLYKPLEILVHCQFKGFSFPPLQEHEENPLPLSIISLKVSSIQQNVISAMQNQALYVSLKEDNIAFKLYLDEMISVCSSKDDALSQAVKKEMILYPKLYHKFFSFNTGLNDFLAKMQIQTASELNAVCLALAGALKSVVVFLFPTSSEVFHVAVPPLAQNCNRLINVYPLFVNVSYDDGEYYFCSTESASEKRDYSSSSDDEPVPDPQPKTFMKCSCGKGRKTTSASCTRSRCPCTKVGQPCGQQCACQLCENNNGRRFVTNQKVVKCRCGEDNQMPEKTFCVSSLCNCRKFGLSCSESPVCSCRQCDNSVGKGHVSKCPPRKRVVTPRHNLLQNSSGKLPDMNSETFFRHTAQKLVQSIWNDWECLLLMSLTRYLKEEEHHVSVRYITDLFNTYSDTMSQIRTKSRHQILYKMRHVDSCRKVCTN